MNAETAKVKHLVFEFNPVHILFLLCSKYADF